MTCLSPCIQVRHVHICITRMFLSYDEVLLWEDREQFEQRRVPDPVREAEVTYVPKYCVVPICQLIPPHNARLFFDWSLSLFSLQ